MYIYAQTKGIDTSIVFIHTTRILPAALWNWHIFEKYKKKNKMQ